MRGKLVESDPMPTWEAFQPYREGFTTLLYEVEEVLEGNYAGGQILVRHWAMMDQKPVPGWPREIGKSYELEVEEWAAHPELTGSRVMETGIFAPDLIVYYDVATPGK